MKEVGGVVREVGSEGEEWRMGRESLGVWWRERWGVKERSGGWEERGEERRCAKEIVLMTTIL